jgi:hypothetical protein
LSLEKGESGPAGIVVADRAVLAASPAARPEERTTPQLVVSAHSNNSSTVSVDLAAVPSRLAWIACFQDLFYYVGDLDWYSTSFGPV